MGSKVSGQYEDVLCTILAVLFLDILLFSYFRTTGIYSDYTFVPIDILFVTAAILLGKKSAIKMEFPVWKVKYEWETDKKQLFISFFIGSCIVLFNTLGLTSSDVSNVSWLKFSNFFQPLFLSLRASLTEELWYRFLLFSVAAQLAGNFFKSRTIGIAIGALVSSFLFGLLHPGFYFSFIIGVGLCYIYKNNGLIFVMVVHFLANFIPYLLIYMR